MRIAGSALLPLLLVGGIATAQRGDEEAAAQAAAQAALPRAEIRSISSEVRTIQGMDGALAGASRSISGEVGTIEGAQRSLTSSGLDTRVVNGGLEVSLPGDVLFNFDQASIRKSAIPTLERVKQAAEQTGQRPVIVDGFTDALGTAAHNRPLSEARARAVADWLAQAGVARSRITSKGHGAESPVAPNKNNDGSDDPAGRQKNRRVTITL
jgi:outer membrane protein OmpA-like peptidoglycan-associated protein